MSFFCLTLDVTPIHREIYTNEKRQSFGGDFITPRFQTCQLREPSEYANFDFDLLLDKTSIGSDRDMVSSTVACCQFPASDAHIDHFILAPENESDRDESMKFLYDKHFMNHTHKNGPDRK
jgi:hypothetical protein